MTNLVSNTEALTLAAGARIDSDYNALPVSERKSRFGPIEIIPYNQRADAACKLIDRDWRLSNPKHSARANWRDPLVRSFFTFLFIEVFAHPRHCSANKILSSRSCPYQLLIKTIDRDKINFVQKLHIRQNFVRTGIKCFCNKKKEMQGYALGGPLQGLQRKPVESDQMSQLCLAHFPPNSDILYVSSHDGIKRVDLAIAYLGKFTPPYAKKYDYAHSTCARFPVQTPVWAEATAELTGRPRALKLGDAENGSTGRN